MVFDSKKYSKEIEARKILKNILIDISIPADVFLMEQIANKFRARNHRILLTTRRFPDFDSFKEKLTKIGAIQCGDYAESLENKLLYSSQRIIEMEKIVLRELDSLDVVISNTGVEACRVGFGLGAKVHTFWDHPQAIPQAKLTLPLSDYIYYPWLITDARGYNSEATLEPYKGFLHLAWIKDFRVDENILKKLYLEKDKPIILFRESETKSAYLLGKQDITFLAIMKLAKKYPEIQFVTKPRYDFTYASKYFPLNEYPNVFLLSGYVDLQSLIAKSSLILGGGATISLEASYFGIPTILCRPIGSTIDEFLFSSKFGLQAQSVEGIEKLFEYFVKYDFKNDYHKEISRRVYEDMEFPFSELIKNVEE